MKSALRHTVRRHSLMEVQYRAHFDLDEIVRSEHDSRLDTLFYYWSAIRCGDRAPLERRFDLAAALGEALTKSLSVIDVSAEDPRHFTVASYAGRWSWFGLGNLSGHRVSDLPAKLHAEESIADYQHCKTTCTPMYTVIDHEFAGIARCYARLLLPLISDDGTVRQLAVASRYIDPPTEVYPSPITGRSLSLK